MSALRVATLRYLYKPVASSVRLMSYAPAFQRNKGENITCFKCGKKGHMANQCTERSDICFNCGEPGHRSQACPKPITCRVCKGTGHISSECTVTCVNCGRKAHSTENCRSTCFVCGQPGHMAKDCTQPRRSNNSGKWQIEE